MTTENVLDALRNVQEPDLGKDLVTLNMVKDIAINGDACLIYSSAHNPCLSAQGYDPQCLYRCDPGSRLERYYK